MPSKAVGRAGRRDKTERALVRPKKVVKRVWKSVPWADRPWCAECKKVKSCRPRGLCWGCYHTPEVRGRHADQSNRPKAELYKDHYGGTGLDPMGPTKEEPGSIRKMKLMMTRLKMKVRLDHPGDALYWGDERPFDWIWAQKQVSLPRGVA